MSYIEYVTHDEQAHDPLPDLARTTGFTMVDLTENVPRHRRDAAGCITRRGAN